MAGANARSKMPYAIAVLVGFVLLGVILVTTEWRRK